MRKGRLTALFVLSTLLSAWTVEAPEAGHIPLPAAAQSHLSSMDVVLGISQTQIYALVDEIYTSQINPALGENGPYGVVSVGGIVAPIVNGVVGDIRTQKVEKAIAPLRSAVSDFSFDSTLQRNLQTSLNQVPWLHAGNASVIRDTGAANLFRTLAKSNSSAVLFVFPDYRLSNDGELLMVQLLVRLVPNDDTLRAMRSGEPDSEKFVAQGNVIYGNHFVFWAKVPPTGDRDRNIAEWTDDNGAAMRTALDLAIKKLSALIGADIQRNETDVAPPSGSPTVSAALPPVDGWAIIGQNGVSEISWQGVPVAQDADGQTLRFRDGSLAYFANSAMTINSRHYQ